MIEIIFTLDYEIYGNGAGSLREHVLEPTRKLITLFQEFNAKMVIFAEAAEFQKIEEYHADETIVEIRNQLRQAYAAGFEIGLHLHPQWCNARHIDGRWLLDAGEYNLCNLASQRIQTIVRNSIDYLRDVLGDPRYVPLSFRAGNWLFQPTQPAAEILYQNGIRIDSSVFKGGRQHLHGLDYRPARKNGYSWTFSSDVNRSDPLGKMLEIPIYTEMVPFWKMLQKQRINNGQPNLGANDSLRKWDRLRDFARFSYPRKLDFCRLNYPALRNTMESLLHQDRQKPEQCKPIVAIGHSKDPMDFQSIRLFLDYLKHKAIEISLFMKQRP